MANSIGISYVNGIYSITRGMQAVGQARSLETALVNAGTGAFPEEAVFHASEVIKDIMGPVTETHGQVATREP